MPFQSTMSRIALAAVVLLSLGFLAHAAPVAAPAVGKELVSIENRGKNCYGSYCYGSTDLEAILRELLAGLEVKLQLLDGCLSGGNYTPIIVDIEGIIIAATAAIKGYNIGLIGLLTGKLLIIAQLYVKIVVLIATHCNKWYGHVDYAIFLGLIVKIDLALKLFLLAIINLGGIFGGFIGICVSLFTQIHIALLVKIKFFLCLGALHLGGY